MILEISVILTDNNCNNLREGPTLVIKVSDEVLDQMSDFVKNMHKTSGLFEEIKASQILSNQAEATICEFLENERVCEGILAGNSVHMDRFFLLKCMPRLFQNYISIYRIIDVSSVKEVFNI